MLESCSEGDAAGIACPHGPLSGIGFLFLLVRNRCLSSKHQKSMAAKKQQMRRHPARTATVNDYSIAQERINRVGAEFLKIDMETAFTFLLASRQTEDAARQ